MSFNSDSRIRVFSRVVLAALLWLTAHAATACAATQAPPAPSSAQSLEGIDWKAIELAGKPVVVENANREPHLLLESGGRVSGSDGCNRIAGSFTVTGDNVTFGQMLGTLMACGTSAESERAFRDAPRRRGGSGSSAAVWSCSTTPYRVAVLEAPEQAPPAASFQLQGTSWQLVRFRGGDDATLTPDDRATTASNLEPMDGRPLAWTATGDAAPGHRRVRINSSSVHSPSRARSAPSDRCTIRSSNSGAVSGPS